jgi:flagellar basal-body rod modification protein FlgD
MQTNTVTGMSSPTASSQGPNNPNSILGKDDFLKILIGQMKNMDPMSADNQDPTQSVAQMAQFSIVEQLTNLTQANAKSSALAMLGKTVTYKVGADGSQQGVVESVDTSGGDPTLTIGGTSGIALSAVKEVR